ncbi:hypothetical protein WA026_023323 [Henosepilachna vigintioctopunctata]|uniref:Uncharacterized protein n=1 Tax=Henosepilachna vigintioctopunctata TaxID=420089 RepID=A0AAW1USP0_9CUCU
MNDTEINKNEIWKEMMNSMIYFTQTSTALINRMQDKLDVSDTMKLAKDMLSGDPNESIKQILHQIDAFEQNSPIVCKCTTSSPNENDVYNSSEDISIGIEYYGQPRPIKRKKFKYPPNLESKILDQKKMRSLRCKCEGEGEDQYVDSCLCDNMPQNLELGTQDDSFFRPVIQCSSLEQNEILNEQCEKLKIGKVTEDKELSESKEDATDSLAEIPKPGTFDPNELPQDDSNPLILKGAEVVRSMENILGFELFQSMKKFGSNIAQIDAETDEKETYDRLLEKCSMVALKLRTKFPRDTIVGIFTSNHTNSAVPLLAALFNGNRVVTFDITMTQTEVIRCLLNVTPSIMFVSTNSLQHLKECMVEAKVDIQIVVFGDEEGHESFSSFLNSESDDLNNFEVNTDGTPDSTAVICFTSGVTGSSKAVCLSHKALLHQCYQIINSGYIQSHILDFSDISKITSTLILFGSILNGNARVITENFDVGSVRAMVEKYKIRSVYLRPHQCVELSSHLQSNEDVSSLFCLFTGGEHLSYKVTRRLNEQLMGCLICQIYENTELSGIGTLVNLNDPADISKLYCKPQSCGKVLDGYWYKIVDFDSGKIVTHNSIGELHVKSKMIFSGYFADNTEIPNDSEWFKTGDLAYYDQHGRFYFVDRMSNLIKYQNNVIIPSKLEDILLNHKSVEMAVVIGVPHDEDGQLATGLVKLIEGDEVSSEELENFVNQQVSDSEKLRGGVKIVQTFHLDNNGKIKR